MSLTISFESEGVLAEQRQFDQLDGLLVSALQQNRSIVLDLGSKQVAMDTAGDGVNNDDVVLRGQRISTEIYMAKLGFRTAICLPFLVDIHQIQLAPGSFATFGRPNRSLGDLFMRNVFYAALRSRLRFENARATAPELSQRLKSCYVWMLRTQFQDALLQDAKPTERFLKACHFGFELVDSPFFAKAAEDFRQRRIQNAAGLSKTANLSRLVGLRSQLMAEY